MYILCTHTSNILIVYFCFNVQYTQDWMRKCVLIFLNPVKMFSAQLRVFVEHIHLLGMPIVVLCSASSWRIIENTILTLVQKEHWKYTAVMSPVQLNSVEFMTIQYDIIFIGVKTHTLSLLVNGFLNFLLWIQLTRFSEWSYISAANIIYSSSIHLMKERCSLYRYTHITYVLCI